MPVNIEPHASRALFRESGQLGTNRIDFRSATLSLVGIFIMNAASLTVATDRISGRKMFLR